MKIRYNAPVVLTLALLATGIMILDPLTGRSLTRTYFTVYPGFDSGSLLSYFRLFSHVLGHRDWAHLMGNFAFILLLGPILEEKYRSSLLLVMVLATALCTGILNILLFSTALAGASGIVFMMILLSSFTNIRSGDIPLTFLLVVAIFLAREVIGAFQRDNISQFAHIMGGFCGSLFGFLLTRGRGASD